MQEQIDGYCGGEGYYFLFFEIFLVCSFFYLLSDPLHKPTLQQNYNTALLEFNFEQENTTYIYTNAYVYT